MGSQKKLRGRRANLLARCLADAGGELRIVHCSRQDQRPNQGRGDAHRLVVGCAPTPFGELALDEPNEVLFLKRFREKHKLPYDFVVTKDQQFLWTYGATALPTTVLIDRKGRVRYFETGSSPSRLEEMRSMMLKLLDEK